MDMKAYYETIDTMEKSGVDHEYIQGWIGGYLQNPKREEQRITDAYEAGYEAGENRDTSGFHEWVKQ
ncbi:MAG: hypothetical protein ACFCVA_04925 [Gammaproteobacteria bacterium]